jgi:hypothetical protein
MKPFAVLSSMLLAVGILAGSASAALLSDPKASQTAWHQMDNCKRQAARQYPDHSPQGLAQRDRAAQRCLDNARLPPIAPLAPPPPGNASSR